MVFERSACPPCACLQGGGHADICRFSRTPFACDATTIVKNIYDDDVLAIHRKFTWGLRDLHAHHAHACRAAGTPISADFQGHPLHVMRLQLSRTYTMMMCWPFTESSHGV